MLCRCPLYFYLLTTLLSLTLASLKLADSFNLLKSPTPLVALEAKLHEALSYHHVEQSESAIQACLMSGYPIVVSIKLFHSFESLSVATTGHVPMPDIERETCLGGHAVCMVSQKSAFIICRPKCQTSTEITGTAGSASP